MSENVETMDFSTEPKCLKVTIGNRHCVLREASEKAYTKYRNVTMRALSFVGDEKERKGQLTGGAEADTVLVSECLFEVIPASEGQAPKERPVPYDQVNALPRRITSRLFNWIRANSGMDEEVETAEFLTKRIASDQAKLEKLTGGTPGKGVPSSTSSTSG